MRLLIALIGVSVVVGAASAQTEKKVWTAAPVPGTGTGNVAPANRAGNTTESDSSSPFSALPSGAQTGARSEQTSRDGGQGTDTLTPNVSK